jgi:SPP1 gp7 family putative phage head morphogenesis protein
MAKKPRKPRKHELDAYIADRMQREIDGFVEKYQRILDKRVARYAKEIRPFWIRALRRIEREIKAILDEYVDANGVPITRFPIAPEKLRNMRRALEHLNLLLAQIAAILKGTEQSEKLRNNLAYTYAESYYLHAFGLEQAARVSVAVPIITEAHVMGVLANPWLPDGATYSERLRANTAYLAQKMQRAVEEATTQGWDWNRTARRIQEIADEGYLNAVRLARTELNRAANQGASYLYMQNADILDGKRWNATLDSRTAPKDAANDGKIYPLEYDTPEMPGRPGERIPNHPNCRCKWSPYISYLGVQKKGRIARGVEDTPDNFGERTYTKAATYREYAKERGLPNLDERLANDDPRKYLRPGEIVDI